MAEVPPKPYVKSLDDELDWKLLDQLYGVVVQMSNFCFEIKKFCVTTQFIVITLLVKFTGDKLDHSLFVAGLAIPIAFWFLDSVAYYYQVKLRGTMEAIRTQIKKRSEGKIITPGSNVVITSERVGRTPILGILTAAFNHSMWMYVLMLVLDLGIWRLFALGVLK